MKEVEGILADIIRVNKEQKLLLDKLKKAVTQQPSERDIKIAIKALIGEKQVDLAREYKKTQPAISRIIMKVIPHLYEKLKIQDRIAETYNFNNFDNFIE